MKRYKAFTLVELLVVVLILGVLAAIVIPKVTNAAATARASMLADDLRIIRTQLEVFRGQHGFGVGYPGGDITAPPTSADVVEQMVSASKQDGQCAPSGTAGFTFGPYLREFPPNPVNEKNTVEVVPDSGSMPAMPDDSHGWVYHPATQVLKADSQGSNSVGVPFFNY